MNACASPVTALRAGPFGGVRPVPRRLSSHGRGDGQGAATRANGAAPDGGVATHPAASPQTGGTAHV